MKQNLPSTSSAATHETAPVKKKVRWGGLVKRISHGLLRSILLLSMLILLLGIACWLVVIKMFNAQQISQAVTYQLQQVFNRPVVISSLNLKFFNTIEIKGFAVLDTEVQPGHPVFSAESISVRYQLIPLLEHQVIIDEVTLNKPRIDVLRSEKGLYNMPPVRMANTQETYVGSGTNRQKFQVRIEDWSIWDGVISYQDQKSGISHAIYGLNLHFHDLQFDNWSTFRLATVLRSRWGDNISDFEIRGTGEINFANFDWEKFALRDFKTQVSAFRKPISLTANIENLRSPVFSLEGQTPAFDQRDLSVFKQGLPPFAVPAATWSAKGNINDTYTQAVFKEVTAQTDLTSLTASGELDFSTSPVVLNASGKTGYMDVGQISKYWPDLSRFKLKGKGAVAVTVGCKKGKYSLPAVEINTQKASGSFWGFEAADISGKFTAKQNWTDLSVQTTSGQVKVADSLFEQLKLSGSYRNDNLHTTISSALLNANPIKLRLTIKQLKKDSRTIDTSLYLHIFNPMKFIDTVRDFTEVISAIAKNPAQPAPVQTGELAWMRNFRDRLPTFMPNFSGTLYADEFDSTVLSGTGFNAEFAFTGLLPGAAQLNGTLDMKLDKGVIHQMEKLAEEQEALNVTFTPFIMLHRMETSGSFKIGKVLKDVAVDEMAVSTDFKNGTMNINNAFTQGPVISAAISGWADWVKEKMELSVWTMIVPSSHRGVLADNLTDESGNPALAFKISSSMRKPKLEMLRAKKTNEQIQKARKRGLRTDFAKSQEFIQGVSHVEK